MSKKKPDPDIVIDARGVRKSFGNLHVLKGLDLQVMRGETVVILGRSGVGKSVLLKHIIGILKPDSGYVDVNGVRVTELRSRQLYRAVKDMGMLFQGAALFDSLTVGENVGFYLRQHGDPETGYRMKEKVLQKRIAEALELVDLSGIQNKMPSDLSGGMKKRAALARLIAYRPHLLLYDEPTTGLDPITAMQINEMIVRTQKELGATSIVVTHDIPSALHVGDRLALHHEGKIAHIAPKKEFLAIDDPMIHAFMDGALAGAKIPGRKTGGRKKKE